MSKAALKGHASGSGIVTLEAPNTNTDRTLSLPDASGTLGIVGPAFRVRRSTGQVASSGVMTKLQCQTKDFDLTSAFDAVTNYRFQPAVPGYYQINGDLYVSGANTTLVIVEIRKNNVGQAGAFHTVPATGDHRLAVADLLYLNGSTDYVEFWGSGTNGGTVTMSGNFSGHFARAA